MKSRLAYWYHSRRNTQRICSMKCSVPRVRFRETRAGNLPWSSSRKECRKDGSSESFSAISSEENAAPTRSRRSSEGRKGAQAALPHDRDSAVVEVQPGIQTKNQPVKVLQSRVYPIQEQSDRDDRYTRELRSTVNTRFEAPPVVSTGNSRTSQRRR
ncbi:hypothetical protein AOLI_G00187600 [Acnodon oligacanthus]